MSDELKTYTAGEIECIHANAQAVLQESGDDYGEHRSQQALDGFLYVNADQAKARIAELTAEHARYRDALVQALNVLMGGSIPAEAACQECESIIRNVFKPIARNALREGEE